MMENQSKFLKSGDYDRIILELLNESENRLGLLCDIFKIQKGRNPDFICLMQNAIDRRKQVIYSKYIEVIKYNPTFQPTELNPLLSLENGLLTLEAIADEEIKPQVQSIQPQKAPKGQTQLSREQTAILFWYLREKSLIAPGTQNNSLSKALELMTGNREDQFMNILRSSGAKVFQLGKHGHRISKNDMERVISELNELIARIKKDLSRYSESEDLN